MPDHKPRPWEKVCPVCIDGTDPEIHLATCHSCHGSGVVPMTTAEMLEALRVKGPTLSWSGGLWRVSWIKVYDDPEDGGEILQFMGHTPDGALRAALEAVG